MAMLNLLQQLEEIDVTKGYGEGGNNLADKSRKLCLFYKY